MENPAYIVDGVFDFALGMNGGINPLLLKRNQLFSATNCTVRGTFVTHRPAYRKIALSFADSTVQTNVESGLWQGGCYYNADVGTSSLVTLISGRLFNFTLADSTANVTEISIPGDLDSPTAPIGWLWQSENYVIVNDGVNLPLFYDVNVTVRSRGQSVVYGSTTTDFTVPNIGTAVNLNLATPYTGPLNVPVLINGALYQVVTSSALYTVQLTNITATPASTVPVSDILNRPSVLAAIKFDFRYGNFPLPAGTSFNFVFSLPYTGGIGQKFTLSGAIWTITAQPTPDGVTAVNDRIVTNLVVHAGALVFKSPATQPNSIADTLTSPFTNPAQGGFVVVNVTAPYTGPVNAVVYIGDAQYTIAALPSPPPGTTITVVNNTDTPGATRVAPLNVNSVPQLPAGRMGAYGMSRNWMSLIDGISFIAGDIVGGSSGTVAFNGRDAVLNVSENTYLNGGGVFRVPGSVGDIRAMRFAATLDASLGQGPLQVYTPNTVFSCNTPVDRTTWQNLTNPILTESLIANGAQGQNSTQLANGDTFFRSIDGMRTLILARREFATWGNVPISREVQTVLNADNKTLLQYGSAIVFDNRFLMTANPQQGPQGVYHNTTVALNFDPISALNQKSQPVYDGIWNGLNVLQFITGQYQGVQRAFSFVLNTDLNKIELWELLATDAATVDNGTDRITYQYETGSLFKDLDNKGPFDLCQLTDGEVFFDNALGRVDFAVYYKPDEYANWVLWWSWSKTNSTALPVTFPRMGLGEPKTEDCDPNTDRPLRNAYTFQFKFVVTGHCRFLGARFKASPVPQSQFAKPICGGEVDN